MDHRVIGSILEIPAPPDLPAVAPPFLGERNLLLANARSGLWAAVRLLDSPRVWLPSYLCGSLVSGVREAGAQAAFYPVQEDLVPGGLDWTDQITPNDLVVSIDYFGYRFPEEVATLARARGAWTLTDASQALLTERSGERPDFLLFSPRKLLGVPDGGVLVLGERVPGTPLHLEDPSAEWRLGGVFAAILRRVEARTGDHYAWFEPSQRFERECPIGPYAMSELSRSLLKMAFDYSDIARRRIGNYALLLDLLGEYALVPVLPEGTVPLGFPVRLPRRDRVRGRLFAADIFPSVHWPVPEEVPDRFHACRRLAADILTLPCDQRYTEEDMRRVAACVLAATRT